jgi:hypothetical protein
MKTTIYMILFTILATNVKSQNFLNPSLESWGSATTCSINTPPDSWLDYSTGGIGADEGNMTICSCTIPGVASNGNTFARMLAGTPVQGEGMYQLVPGFTVGGSYTIKYDYCGTNLWGGSDVCIWHLFIDDVDVNQSPTFSSSYGVWQTNTYTFIATLATHKIGVRAYTPAFGSAGGSAAIDNFTLTTTEIHNGIDNYLNDNSVRIYPNPFSNETTISFPTDEIHTIKIIDLLGKEIKTASSTGKQYIIEKENMEAGIYFVQITDERKTTVTRKIIVK